MEIIVAADGDALKIRRVRVEIARVRGADAAIGLIQELAGGMPTEFPLFQVLKPIS